MANRINLTPATIEAKKIGTLACPDTASKGLFLECLPTGKKIWKYRRKIAERSTSDAIVNLRLGMYAHHTIAEARAWARKLNVQILAGNDPRVSKVVLTVAAAHAMYMEAMEAGTRRIRRRADKGSGKLKDSTKRAKRELYTRYVEPVLGERMLSSITKMDLNQLIEANSENAPVQMNRLGCELRVFWSWCLSPRGQSKNIMRKSDPTVELSDFWNTESAGRGRWINHAELPVWLQALAVEDRLYRRALLLWLLTGTRKMELLGAKPADLVGGIWNLSEDRTKNGLVHPIKLGRWALRLFETNDHWVITSRKIETQAMLSGWDKVHERIRTRMEKIGGVPVEKFTTHDLRRSFRSHMGRIGVNNDLAKMMMNYKKSGLDYRYDRDDRIVEMGAGFLKWEQRLAEIATEAGVADALEVTKEAETLPILELLAA